MSTVGCPKVDEPGHDSMSCLPCLQVQLDFCQDEVKHLLKCLETPATKLKDEADAFIAKMRDRGITRIDDPAVSYHLALLIRTIRTERG